MPINKTNYSKSNPEETDWTKQSIVDTDYTKQAINNQTWEPDDDAISAGTLLLEIGDKVLLENGSEILLQ